MEKRYDLVVLGDLVADIIMPVTSLPLRANEHDWADGLFTELGGSCTTLVAARRLDLSVAALGMVGGDAYGTQVLEMLSDEGIDVSQVVAPAERQTVLCVVVTDKAGQHVFLGIKDGKPPERCPAVWQDTVRRARSVFTTGYTLRDMLDPEDALTTLAAARAAGVPVFFDPGPSIMALSPEMLARALEVTSVLLLTGEEADYATRAQGVDAAKALLARGPQVVVLKLGPEGCIVAHAEGLVRHEGFDVEVVDTVGAGDAFVAAFIAGHLRGGNWRECAALANAMGAAVAASQGAGRNVPPAARVRELLAHDAEVARLVAGELTP